MTGWHLAQINIGRLKEPLTSPLLRDFVDALAPINAVADASPGFVWRLQTEEGDATSIKAFEDDAIIVNMSVWQSLEALSGYVYRTAHADVMRQRRKWFRQMKEMFFVLWWVPAGHIPGVAEGVERLRHLQQHGPSAHAFTFKEPFAAPDATAAAVPVPVEDECTP